ncbi:MAG: DNA replication/repair protein RecF [Bacilli bacterium]|jgi:DNA replication and repair protein RecF
MIIKQLQLKHFRNYEEMTVNFNNKINIFIGKNAQGKTNILESIYTLAITKSHRTHFDTNLIKKDCKCAKIRGTISKKNQKDDSELEVLINNKGKKASINHNPTRKISDYISYFNVIIFHPDDLDIIKGSPVERRKFLNIEIGQLDNRYFLILNNYNTILKNRNEYLKRVSIGNYDANYLEILTNQLIDNAIKIYAYRHEFVDKINVAIELVNGKIQGLDNLSLKYETSLPLCNNEDMRQKLLAKFHANIQKEIAMSQTMIGPHRDDFLFFTNGRNLKEFGSQGQQRMAVLSLKLAEIELFKEEKGEYPVLLLDDIFSELDSDKRHKIIKYLNKRMQIIITTTDISDIEKSIIARATIFLVDKAQVVEKVIIKERYNRGESNGRK